MTEAQWLALNDPRPMLKYLRRRWSQRKVRLFRSESQLADYEKDYSPEQFRELWGELEYWVNGRENEIWPGKHLEEFWWMALQMSHNFDFALLFRNEDWLSAEWLVAYPVNALGQTHADFAACIREIAGNPFRPVTFAPSWRTSDVTLLAQSMYDTREFSAMPILADALQDAGCGNTDILNHCRAEVVHVRGCWVVDSVLGKS